MLAMLSDRPFDDANWIFEIKWDGFRAVADWQNKNLKFYSRNGLSFLHKFPIVSEAVRKIKRDVVLDGEIVLMNEEGRPDFEKLQQYEDNRHLPLIYYVFDLLFMDGNDLRRLPLVERKKHLKGLIRENPVIKYCDHVEEHGY